MQRFLAVGRECWVTNKLWAVGLVFCLVGTVTYFGLALAADVPKGPPVDSLISQMAVMKQAARIERKSSQVVIVKTEAEKPVEAPTREPENVHDFTPGQSGIEFAQPEFDDRKDVAAPPEDVPDLLKEDEPVRTEKFDAF